MMNTLYIVGFDNMMTNTSVSIFNKNTDTNTKKTTYKKHVIEHAFWDDSLGINLQMGYENADKVNIYVPFDKNESDLTNYVEPNQYNGTGWTIQNGDFIIKGQVDEEVVDGIKDLKSYQVFVITVCDKKDFGSYNMQHFEIRGH